MAYKKYIKRGGKLYGPYLYESKRVNGKVVSEYHGQKKEISSGRIAMVIVSALLLAGMIYLFSYSETGNFFTGNAILGTSAEYAEGLPLSGNITISLKHGELLPADAMFVLENEGQRYEYPLKNVLSYSTKNGKFYLDGSNIEGEGEGYGEEGEIMIYPEVSFVLIGSSAEEIIEDVPSESSEKTDNVGNNSLGQAEENNETAAIRDNESIGLILEESSQDGNENETSPETEISPDLEITPEIMPEIAQPESPSETIEEPVEQPPISNFFLGIYNFFIGLTPTGRAVDAGISGGEINGKASSGNPFFYEYSGEGEVYLKPGSVYASGAQIPDDTIKISQNGSAIYVETSYSTLSRSFGEEYLGNEFGVSFNVDLSSLGLLLNSGELKTSLIYNNEEIMSNVIELVPGINSNSSSLSSSSLLDVNATIPPENITLAENLTELNATAPPLQVITSETVGFVLTESEKALLAEEFGAEDIKTTTKLFNERLVVRNEIGNYWIENSYEPSLTEQELDYQMSLDRMKWLKDVAYRLNAEKLQEQSQSQETTENTPIF